MTTAEAVILAIVEGITEYLPVSSTGHLILTEALLKMQKSTFNNLYIVNVQFGAILSVIFIYWRRFFQSFDFYLKLLVAFIPAAVLGFLLNDFIDSLLSSVVTVAVSLIVGGVVLIFVDKVYYNQMKVSETEKEENQKQEIGWLQALLIGCFQCIAMIPGVSRSAATIVGGLQQGLNIKMAAEFSFFLAVPTIAAAALYKLIKSYSDVKATDMDFLIIGNAISFVVGMIAIKFFIQLITHHGLKFFGYYRILLGVFILILMMLGHNLEITE